MHKSFYSGLFLDDHHLYVFALVFLQFRCDAEHLPFPAKRHDHDRALHSSCSRYPKCYVRKHGKTLLQVRLFLAGKNGSYAGLFLANVEVDDVGTGAGLCAGTGDGLRCGTDAGGGLLVDAAAAVGLGLFADEPLVRASSLRSLASCSCLVWLMAEFKTRSA